MGVLDDTDGSTRTMTQCVTADKASEVNGDTQSARSNAEKHSMGSARSNRSRSPVTRSRIHWPAAPGQIDSVTTFPGDSSEGTLVTTSDGNSVTTQVRARRLGACP
jgi:hypothetical protein